MSDTRQLKQPLSPSLILTIKSVTDFQSFRREKNEGEKPEKAGAKREILLTAGDSETLHQSNHQTWHSKRSTEPPPHSQHPPLIHYLIVSLQSVQLRLHCHLLCRAELETGERQRERETSGTANQNANICLPIGVLVHLGGWISRL